LTARVELPHRNEACPAAARTACHVKNEERAIPQRENIPDCREEILCGTCITTNAELIGQLRNARVSRAVGEFDNRVGAHLGSQHTVGGRVDWRQHSSDNDKRGLDEQMAAHMNLLAMHLLTIRGSVLFR
jgi:hypothetical protein